MTIVNTDKHTLRLQLLQHRQALPLATWQSHSDLICAHLADCSQFITARTILAYQSHRQEPNLADLFTHAPQQWGLPRSVGKDLLCHRWHQD